MGNYLIEFMEANMEIIYAAASGGRMNTRMQVVTVVLVMAMFAAAGWLDEKAVIFPEIAALACGAWVMKKPPWHFTALQVWLSPTLAALTGVAVLRYLPAAPVIMVSTAFIAVALQLRLTNSAVVPALSAAILPILTKVDSLIYPVSVCVLTGVIALVHLTRERCSFDGRATREVPVSKRKAIDGLKLWTKLALAITLVSVAAVQSQWLYLIAPPLIVTFVELSNPGGHLRSKLWQVLVLLALAAVAGVGCLYLIHDVMHWPVWASAGITLSAVFVFYGVLQLPFPPAAAIALLPTIIPAQSLWVYPWHVVLGSVIFALLSVLCFPNLQPDAPARADASPSR